MIRSMYRTATLGVATLAAALGAQAASASLLTVDFTRYNASASGYNALSYTLGGGADPLTLNVVGGHLGDPAWWSTLAKVSSATAETWAGWGLGVLSGSDSTGNGTHQIDNAGSGVDFVALEFNQAVTLSTINRVAYGGRGVGTGTDLSYLAYAGTPTQLQGAWLDESGFTTLSGGATSTGSAAVSKIWLVAADVTSSRGDDAFKLTNLTVNTVAAVPEPASWALMLAGFGAVGIAMRRRRAPGAVAIG